MPIDYQKDGALLKAMGHPVRLQIVAGLLHQHECHVNKMVEGLNLPQSTVSQHLAQLRSLGTVEIRKEGVRTCYRVVDRRVREIVKILGR